MTASTEKYILAIDLGTSGPKSALISTRGEVIDYEFENVDLLILPDGGAEQIPDHWWQAVLNRSKRVLEKHWSQKIILPESCMKINEKLKLH